MMEIASEEFLQCSRRAFTDHEDQEEKYASGQVFGNKTNPTLVIQSSLNIKNTRSLE